MSIFQPPQVPINIGLAPQQSQGARMVGPINLTWTQTAGQSMVGPIISDDLIIEGEDGSINNIQSIYFDNSTNPNYVLLTLGDTLQLLTIPPKSQGYLPILATNSLRYTAQTFGGAIGFVQCNLMFFNVPVQPIIWQGQPAIYDQKLGANNVINAGNTAISLQCAPGFNLVNKTIWVHGININGTGATTETFGTWSISNTVPFITDNTAHTVSGGFDIPAIPGNVSVVRTFNPPLRATQSLVAGVGFFSAQPTLTVPAMGVGQLGASAEIYFSCG